MAIKFRCNSATFEDRFLIKYVPYWIRLKLRGDCSQTQTCLQQKHYLLDQQPLMVYVELRKYTMKKAMKLNI